MRVAPKGNYISPPDRPKWQGNESFSTDLLYLGWGRRYHGIDPAPAYRHLGWLYILLISGNPKYIVNGVEMTATPQTLIIIDPECSFGVTDRKNAHCTWLLWIWKESPAAGIEIPTRGHHIYSLSNEELNDLKTLHHCCRLEVATLDHYTDSSLRLYHKMLDIRIRRLSQARGQRTAEVHLLQMGLNWLRLNMRTRRPVALLCEYLQLSPSKLSRLFIKHLKKSPAQYHQHLRMNWAKTELKREKVSIKAVAYDLGFQHPGDFTRAYRSFHGILPKQTKNGAKQTYRRPGKKASTEAQRTWLCSTLTQGRRNGSAKAKLSP